MTWEEAVCRIAIAFAVGLFCFQASAQPAPKVPTTLPNLDWKCFASFSVAFRSPGHKFQETGLDGDNLKQPRIELHTVNNTVLKVIENPTHSALRKEYAVQMHQMTQDFSMANPVYSWREDSGTEVRMFTFNVDDRILSIVRVMKEPARISNTNVVLVCK